MKKLKTMAMLLGIVGVLGQTIGCGQEKKEEISENVEDRQEIELSVLLVGDPETDNPWKFDSFEEAAKNLGYKVNVERVDDATYKTKIKVMLQANELPDLFYTWGGSYSTPFLEADAMYPLEDTLENSGYDLQEIYTQKDGEGHFYTVPTTALESYCLFYNKSVFQEIEKEVPTTWDELLDVVKVCNANGIGAIGLGDKDRWEGDLFYNMMVLREDADAFAEAVEDGGTFTSQAFVKAAEKVETLVEMGAFQNGYMQAAQTECVELLKAGKIAMYPAGSWQLSAFQDDENMGCTVFPKTGEEDPYLSCCSNAADSGMAVNANSEHVEEAAQLAIEYSKCLNDHLAESGEQTFFETDTEMKDQTEMMRTYVENFNKLEKTQLWWYTYLDTAVGEPMRDLSQQQFAGEISTEDFIEQLERTIKG